MRLESQAEAYQGRMAQETDGRLREMWDSAERYNRELSRGAAVLTDPVSFRSQAAGTGI